MSFIVQHPCATKYEEIEHEQPADCFMKSSYWWFIISQSYSFFRKVLYFITDYICGDKCAVVECKCGNETFSPQDHNPYYCCIPKNESCEENHGIGNCQTGQKKSSENFCEHQGECPISQSAYVAIKSNCTSNHDCPVSSFSSRVCNDRINISVDYCQGALGQNVRGKLCPLANKGLYHQQCYNQ